MAASRELKALLNNRRTTVALERHFQDVFEKLRKQMIAGVTQVSSARIAATVAEINRIAAQLGTVGDTFVRRWVRRNMESAFVLGDDAASRRLRSIFKAAKLGDPGSVRAKWGALNQTQLRAVTAAFEATLRGKAEAVRELFGTVVRRTQTTLARQKAIQRATVNGVIKGSTGKQVADDIASVLLKGKVSPAVRKRLAELGFRAEMFKDFEAIARGQIIQVGATRQNVRVYSKMVARTQMREAHKIATLARLQQNSVEHVQISQHQQAEPDECTPWAGNVYYIGEGEDPLGFPRLDSVTNGGPPFHPNCEHVILPYVVAFKTDEAIDKDLQATNALPKRFFGKGANDVRKLVGEVPRSELRKLAPRGVGDLKKAVA